jgi:phosphate-selective porin OprO/OprP
MHHKAVPARPTHHSRKAYNGLLLAALFSTVCSSALAQSDPAAIDTNPNARIAQLEAQVAQLAAQIQDLKTSTARGLRDVRTAHDETKISLVNARPSFATADGQFSASLRGVVHFDAANYAQDGAGPLASDFRRGSFGDATEASRARDLNNGTNFRRARIGLEGKAFGDFDYSLIYEFGGSGSEEGGRVQDLWLQYSGLKPFRFRIGAFAPPTGLEDAGSTNSSLFVERGSAAEIVRAIGGGDGRSAAAVYANGDHWFASGAITGQTVGNLSTTNPFDEQLAFVGRLAATPLHGYDWLVHVGVNSTKVLSPADNGPDATGARYGLRLRDRPELRVDGTRLIDTGNIDADGLTTYGLELAGQYKSLYVQSEYETIRIDRRLSALSNPEFSGWYVQGSWIATGEARRYNPLNAGFDGPKVDKPFDLKKRQWGAWELGARYSTIDLNWHAGSAGQAALADSVRGGQQTIWALGVNWYLNPVARIMLQYQDVDIDRLSPGGTAFGAGALTPPAGRQIGQKYQATALRTQIAF